MDVEKLLLGIKRRAATDLPTTRLPQARPQPLNPLHLTLRRTQVRLHLEATGFEPRLITQAQNHVRTGPRQGHRAVDADRQWTNRRAVNEPHDAPSCQEIEPIDL